MFITRPTILLIAILGALVLSFSPPAQPVVLEEVIVQVPQINPKNLNDIRSRLTSFQGVYVNGYCEKLQIFLIRIDRARQSDNGFLESVFHEQYQLSYYIKESCTIEQVRTMCDMPSEASEPAQNPQ